MTRAFGAGEGDWGCDVAGRGWPRRRVGRRAFLRDGALALIGTSAIPAFLTRSVLAEAGAAAAKGKVLVVLFQRGAVDGLNVVVPYTDPHYAAMRPAIALKPAEVLDLDGRFGFHPAMASLKPLYDQGHLAVLHAAGSPDPTRSHFEAQDYMESGTPGVKATADGWLNRALPRVAKAQESPFRAIAVGPQLPRTLQGEVPAVALTGVNGFTISDGKGGLTGQTPATATGTQTLTTSQAIQALYDRSSDTLLHGTGQETFDAVKMLRSADPAQYKPMHGAVYPNSVFGSTLRQTAQLLKANLGVQAAFADTGGWDTHHNQGAATGQLANRLREFSTAIAAFWQDMGDAAEGITLVTMSEFGRTAGQNGTGGTDHGHANVMLVLGGSVRGGRVYGQWPGLAPEQLNDGRDLRVTTDFRRVLAEATVRTLGDRQLERVFPGAGLSAGEGANGFLNLLRA